MNGGGGAASARQPFWTGIFGTPAPVEIEIGCGDGALLLALAARDAERNFLGIEHSRTKAARLALRVARRGASHLRTLHADAHCVVCRVVPDASVAAYHVYFPDPWPKRRHASRRIFDPAFVAGLARTLLPGGRLWIATDVQSYAATIRSRVQAHGAFEEEPVGDDHPGLQTSFARKYRAAGRPLYPAVFLRRHAWAALKIRST